MKRWGMGSSLREQTFKHERDNGSCAGNYTLSCTGGVKGAHVRLLRDHKGGEEPVFFSPQVKEVSFSPESYGKVSKD